MYTYHERFLDPSDAGNIRGITPMDIDCNFGQTTLGDKEETDNITLDSFNYQYHYDARPLVTTLQERQQRPRVPIDPQKLFGVTSNAKFLVQPIEVPNFTFTPGMLYTKERRVKEGRASINWERFASFIADFVSTSEICTEADTVILVVDSRPFTSQKQSWAQSCARRLVQRSKLMIKERTMVAYLHVGPDSGLQQVNPCYLTPIVLAALRAIPHLDHVHLVGSDLDIYQNGVVDVEQQVNLVLPLIRERLQIKQEIKAEIAMFWFSEVRLQNNAGRLVCPAPDKQHNRDLGVIDGARVLHEIRNTRRALWETRLSQEEVLAMYRTQVSEDAAYSLNGTRISATRTCAKLPLREMTPRTPAQVLSMFSLMCETTNELCYPPTESWTYQDMKTPCFDWMHPELRNKLTTSMVSWGMIPCEQAFLELLHDLTMPACKACCLSGPGLFMDLAPPPEDLVDFVGADTLHGYGWNDQAVDTKTFLSQYGISRTFFTLPQIIFGSADKYPSIMKPEAQISTGLNSRPSKGTFTGGRSLCGSAGPDRIRIPHFSSE